MHLTPTSLVSNPKETLKPQSIPQTKATTSWSETNIQNGIKKPSLKSSHIKSESGVNQIHQEEVSLTTSLTKEMQGTSQGEGKGKFTKGTWKEKEDKQLISLVSSYGPQNWTRIAEFIPHRSGKQCRERWHNHLNPNINKQKWSVEEDRILIEAHKK
jgi:hypothetical protein